MLSNKKCMTMLQGQLISKQKCFLVQAPTESISQLQMQII